MITFAPLLGCKNLIKAIFMRRVDDKVLAQQWCKQDDLPVWFSKTAWSLATISLWWEKSFLKKRPTIFVPGYFCNQSLWPLRKNDVNLIFYPVKDKLLPDWDACYELVKESKPDIFILTHFYGLISDVSGAKKFCDEHGALFVEDAAHFMLPVEKVGVESHFVLYSPHKFFPISQGALCIIRPSVRKFVSAHQGRHVDFPTIRAQLGSGSYPFFKWLVRQTAKNITRDYLSRFKSYMPYELDGANQPMPAKPYMSPWAKKLLSLELRNIPSYINHRKKCAQLWEYLLVKKGVQMERVINSTTDDIPYVAVFNSTYNEAPAIYKQLTQAKWPVSSWPDLPPEVRKNTELHASTIHFRNNMIIFPTNQSLKTSELLKKYGGNIS